MPASLVALLVLLRLLIRSRVDLQLGKLGSAPSNRRASTLAEETPENNRNGLSLPKIMSDCRINELRLLQGGPGVLAEFWRGTRFTLPLLISSRAPGFAPGAHVL